MAIDDIQFEPAWNYPEAYAPRNLRPPRPSLPLRYPDEPSARHAFDTLIAPRLNLTLVTEVRLLDRGWPFQWIDYVALCPEGSPWPAFGIEAKSGFPEVKEACDAVEQARRYRKAVVSDDRVCSLLNEHLPYIFIWPSLRWHAESTWEERKTWGTDQHRSRGRAEGEERAIRLLAGRTNIGSIDAEYQWVTRADGSDGQWRLRVSLMLGQQGVWSSDGFDWLDGYFGPGAMHGKTPKRGLRSVE